MEAVAEKEDPQALDPAKTRVVLFTMNGKRYTVPAKPRPVYTLRFLDRVRKQGVEVALAHLLPELLGEDTWSELLEEDDLEPEHLSAILEAVKRLLMGEVDASGFTSGR